MLIDLSYLIEKYQIKPTGVLHIGASYGQEASAYHKHNLKVVWIEAIREVYKQLCRNVTPYTGTICINACVSDKEGEIVDFHISNNEFQSSSLLEFGTHTKEHPGVVFTSHTRLQTRTVKSIFEERNLEPGEYDFINLDIQGAELMALKGMDLRFVNYVYIEVNVKELYKGCPLLPEIDDYLKQYDLHRVETKITNHGWGDAFYIKDYRIEQNMVQVPTEYRPKHPFAYPGDNDVEFERCYYNNYTPMKNQQRTYLPVMWTAYYCMADKNQNRKQGMIKNLQSFLNTLDRSKKYYTIVQYDDGIINDISHLDIKVFSMSGKPMHYPLPLICKPHDVKLTNWAKMQASFVGRITHPIRDKLMKMKHPRGWYISDKPRKMQDYCSIIAASTFTLCPRGYGPTSFRICEALQYGSIPVYISDEFIEPHMVDFNLYGVKVHLDDIGNLSEILNNVNMEEKQAMGTLVYGSKFTFKANKEIIDTEICSPL